MNSGELDLKTRRNVSLAPAGAGEEYAAPAAMQARPANNVIRRREVLIAWIRCAPVYCELCRPFECRLFSPVRLPPRSELEAAPKYSRPADQTACALAPLASGTKP